MFTAYKPHLGFCTKPFTVKVNDEDEAIMAALCLHLYQTFLFENRHSQSPKPHLEFWKNDKATVFNNNQRLVNTFNDHHIFDIGRLEDLKECFIANKHGLVLGWYPQIHCEPFYFPVQSVEQAVAFYNMLGQYDLYLFEDCDSMRVDYSNMGFLLKLNCDWNEGDDPDVKWEEWSYYGADGEYYDDIQDYRRNTQWLLTG